MSIKVTLAKSAGFCFGVNRAVELCESLIKQGKKVCTLGPIIHNPQLVEELKSKGVVTVKGIEDVPQGYTVVIRSHGIAPRVYEEISARNIPFCDATCPFVQKIHKIVSENSSEQIPVFIAGDENHAEVIGIKGYCKSDVFCFESYEEFCQIAEKCKILAQNPFLVVAQTTFCSKKWDFFKKNIKKLYTNAIFFDTICSATVERQNEALLLAEQNDLIFIVGGKESSNTKKLSALCGEKTKTFLVETAAELNKEMLAGANRVGVSAGASTPGYIIKEVLNKMTDIIKNEETMGEATAETTNTEVTAAPQKPFEDMTFEEALEQSLNSINSNQKVKGTVISVNPSEVHVDIGRKHTGVIPIDELSADPSLAPEDIVKVGDEIDLVVMKTNDQEGITTLSKKRFDSFANLAAMEKALEDDAALEGKVTAVVKGGVTVSSGGVRVFVPASHATLHRGEELENLVGTNVKFKVIDIRRGRSVVGSIRLVLRDEQKAARDAFWATVEIGKSYEGIVKSLTSYGAFVDIGGVDGMIHITELSWTRIKHPSEIVNVGDTVTVYVKDIDAESKKISLGFKKADENPWEIIRTKYQVGDTAKVKIVSFASYGAFANLMTGIDGLIHISQIDNKRIEKPQDVLQIGDEVEAKITAIDYDAKRVSLSIRALLPEELVEEAEEESGEATVISTEDDLSSYTPAEDEVEEEAPKAEEPKAREPAAEEPKAEESAAEEVKTEEKAEETAE